jgi:hypothetical protein
MTILWCVGEMKLTAEKPSFQTEVCLNFIQKPTSAAAEKT